MKRASVRNEASKLFGSHDSRAAGSMEGVGQTGGQTFQVNGRVEGVREEVGYKDIPHLKIKKKLFLMTMDAVNQYRLKRFM